MYRLKIFLRSVFGERVWSVIQWLSALPRHRLIRLCRRETKGIVRGGPFAGMNYIHDTIGGGYVPKLLGIYERELHLVIRSFAAVGIHRVINVGAADGYYAVGLSRMSPDLRVVAFEMEQRGREFLRAMAERNGVLSRIEIRGRCEPVDLASVLMTAPQIDASSRCGGIRRRVDGSGES